MARILYVAEPIDQSDFGSWKESVSVMTSIATKRGWLAFRPSNAWALAKGSPIGPEIEQLNRGVMANSGGMIAHLPHGVPSVGVPREIEWAVANELPVLVATDRKGWSLYDVDVIEIGDAAGFGLWIEKVEAYNRQPKQPVAFLVEGDGQLPAQSHQGDAGYDLFVSADVIIEPGGFADVPCGVRAALPPGIWGRITGRSSTFRRRNLLVIEGVIDTGYRGPLYAGVTNLGDEAHTIKAGERVAQLVLHENVAAKHYPYAVDRGLFDRIPSDSRGEAGFGSSGD